jgi:LPS-assembly lipoprotein
MVPLPRRGLLMLLSGGAVAGCGFQPVYMPTASGKVGPALRELAAVEVPVLGDRPGQLLRQALQDRFGNDSGVPHRYNLKINYWISGEGINIQPDNTATRIRLIGNANWELVDSAPPQRSLTKGTARSVDGVNIFDTQYFAADRENEMVQRRIAGALADQMALQLAAYFRRRANVAG